MNRRRVAQRVRPAVRVLSALEGLSVLRVRSALRVLLALLVLSLGAARAANTANTAPAAPAPSAPTHAAAAMEAASQPLSAAALALAIEKLAWIGESHPEEAIDALGRLPQSPAVRRPIALARARVAARSLPPDEVARWRAELVETSAERSRVLADADGRFIDALDADRRARPDAAERAASALAAYDGYCGADAACEAGPRVQLMMRLADSERIALKLGQAQQRLAAAVAMAQAAGLPTLQALAESHRALTLSDSDLHAPQVDAAMQRARRLAQQTGSAQARVTLAKDAATLELLRGHLAAADARLREAQAEARHAGDTRTEMLLRTNQSHLALQAGRAAEALALAEHALPAARRYGDVRTERILLHNAAMALVALRRFPEAERSFEAVTALWQRDDALGDIVEGLAEYGAALHAAGDLQGALKAHRRERELWQRMMRQANEAAVAELRQRHDREAQAQRLALAERDNRLRSAQLDTQQLVQRVAIGVTGVALVALAVMWWLWRRLRHARALLVRHRARLHSQSETDALTGIANRRHFHALLKAAPPLEQAFEGGLLLLDVDHFKPINDLYGHGVGDEVLMRVAARLQALVGPDDTLVRWGGEEFLLWSRQADARALEALAGRALDALARDPVRLSSGALLSVGASIGGACWPLPPGALGAGAMQALAFVDRALYLAKARGRNRAVLIESARADDVESARALLDDAESARARGVLEWHERVGPSAA